MEYTDIIRLIPPGRSGVAEIVHDKPSEVDRIRGAISGMPLDRDGYVRLLVRGNLLMTDAEFERRSNRPLLTNAHGKCLVAGLGIGLILEPLSRLCDSVMVVEIEQDVINLVGMFFSQCTIVQGDIFRWKPANGDRFDTIYFDIWPHYNSDTVKEASKLHRRFRRYLAPDGYMESWCRLADRLRPSRWWWSASGAQNRHDGCSRCGEVRGLLSF